VRKFIYLTTITLDIFYIVGIVSQFMHNPHIDHCNVVARTFRYVQKALGQGLLYEGKEYIQIFGYCDADGVG